MLGDHEREIATLLERVAALEIDADEALLGWSDVDKESDPLLAIAWHQLSHFAADRDIRQRDSAYARRQQTDLRRIAQSIRDRYSGER